MMHWESLSQFLSMGGYAFYVWSSFGLTAACMAVEILLLRRRHRALASEEGI